MTTDRPMSMAKARALTKKLRACAELLAEHEIKIVLCYRDKHRIKIEEIPAIIRDRDTFVAECLRGVSVETLHAFRTHDWQCRAVKRDKKRCLSPVLTAQLDEMSDLPDDFCPVDFLPSEARNQYCRFHLKHLGLDTTEYCGPLQVPYPILWPFTLPALLDRCV